MPGTCANSRRGAAPGAAPDSASGGGADSGPGSGSGRGPDMPGPDTPSSDIAAPDTGRIRVLLPLPLAGPYDYRAPLSHAPGGQAPGGQALVPGTFLRVPLGGREVTGCVWDPSPARSPVAAARLKAVGRCLPAPPLPAVLRRFVDWVAAYTCTPAGAVLKMVMSVPAALEEEAPVTAFALAPDGAGDGAPESAPESAPDGAKHAGAVRMTPARRRVMAVLAGGPPRAASELAREAGVSPGVVRAMVSAGLLDRVRLPPPAPFAMPDWRRPEAVLSPGQRAAADALGAAIEAGGYGVTLLDGVTGSGKTEVYFTAIAAALEKGAQVLVMVPEIALTAQWLSRFEDRFGAAAAVWHSELTPARRRRTWRAVAEGRAQVVVGARSALFLPFAELGLIIVDEEHDPSFKQEEGVVYHGRDMAVVRARLGAFPILLVSATPSLETVVNVDAGRYRRLHLPDRFAGARLPEIQLIDMRTESLARQSWLSPTLRAALTETLGAGEQAMLFLNRRGYAPLTLCRHCGHRLQCPNCTAWLVQHRGAARLMCHHCGHAGPVPKVCPTCGEADSFAACGPGVERLAEEVAALIPDLRFEIMASDTLTGPEAAAALTRRVEAHEIDLLIGTQVMAKGHHFPMLTLVGVVDADLGLAGGDLRAAERTYQLLSQVAGRAGRAAHPGRVFLQTYMPEHAVMQALGSGARDRFYAAEAAARQAQGMPPFGRLAAVIVSGPDEGAVAAAARRLARTAPDAGLTAPGITVLGPAPAPLGRLAGRYRWRLLVKAPKNVRLQPLMGRWMAAQRPRGALRIKVDIDPYSFL